METLYFTTNILSSEAIAVVSTALNSIEQVDGWSIDPVDHSCLLTVQTTDSQIADLVAHAVRKAGYQAEQLLR